MKRIMLASFVLLLFGGTLLAGEKKIAVVLKALDSEFWLSVRAGAEAAAKENPGVKLTVLAPDREINVQNQVQIVEDVVTQGADALVISPSGSKELIPAMEHAHKAGIPVVVIDTNSPFEKKVTFVGTDNITGGKLAGNFIAKELNGKGKVAIITGIMGHATAMEREQGADAAFKAYPDIEVVSRLTANWERSTAMTVMENILSTHPDLAAVFCANDSMALGAFEAVRAEKAKVIIVGFDANTEAVEQVKKGNLAATVAQNSFNIGKMGVESAIKALNGEKLPDHIDTGTILVTRENAAEFLK